MREIHQCERKILKQLSKVSCSNFYSNTYHQVISLLTVEGLQSLQSHSKPPQTQRYMKVCKQLTIQIQ